jgi:YVTN family beta-propeller protein
VSPVHPASAVHAAAAVITVGGNPFYDAVNPLTNQIYVANFADFTMSVINGANNSVNTVPAGIEPYGVATNPVTGNVYMTLPILNEVLVFSSAGSLITTIADASFDEPNGVAVNPVSNLIYVTNGGCSCGNTVSVISGATNAVVAVIPVGNGPFAVAVNPVTNRIYVANCDDGTISVIDGATNTVIGAPIPDGNPAPSSPQGIAVNPVTNKIYVTDSFYGTLLTIDGSTNTPGVPQTIGFSTIGVAVDPIRNLIYVADAGVSQAYAVSGSNGSVTTLTDPSFAGTFWVALNPNTNLIYFTNASSNTVTVLQGSTGPTATSPTESCNPSILQPGASTTCTVVLTSAIPIAGTISKQITSPAAATISSCGNASGGLTCGSQPNATTLNLSCQSFSGTCAAGSSFQVVIAGASSSPLSEMIAVTPPGGGTPVSFNLTGLTAPASGTTVVMSSSQNPSAPGQPVTLTATVTCPGFTPTGMVTFTIDGTAGSPVALTNGSASVTTSSLAPGSHSVTAAYSGDANCVASTSSAFTQSVGTAGSSVTLASSSNPSTSGQTVTITATVGCPNFTPAGTVTFTVDGTAGLPITLSGNPTTLTTSSLVVGAHSITAAYSGDANCAPGTSTVLTQTVNAAATTAAPVGYGYCFPAANAPPPGAPCTPFTGNVPPGQLGPIALCMAAWPTVGQQQSCIAQEIGNVGGFICPIGCGTAPATSPSAALPGAYCSMPDGARQWVPQSAPAPAGCT